VLAAIDGKPALTECCQSVHFCSQDPICAIKDNWKIVNHIVLSALESLSLADMTKSLHAHPLMHLFKNLKTTQKAELREK
jgi:DNA-binding IscR family transcriptional regulator